MKRSNGQRRMSPFAAMMLRGMRRAAKAARKTAKMHGGYVYYWRNGKVVAEKP